MDNDSLCPCCSQKPYCECCKRYHDGAPAENALALMRSRYAAYALHLADYIVATTHPDNPAYSPDSSSWKKEILRFSHNTSFVGLKIVEFIDGAKSAYVTFTAYLKQNGQDATFTEKSHFVKVGGRWFYKNCQTAGV